MKIDFTNAEIQQILFELRSGLEVVEEDGEWPVERELLKRIIAKIEEKVEI